MTDVFTKKKRSEIMSKVRSTNTKPEIIVRKWLHKSGYRFRLYKKKMPGSPDIVLPKYNIVINVNGCFWHRHEGCKNTTTPKSNVEYWENKFKRNVERDKNNKNKLESMGWKIITLWECEVLNGNYAAKLKDLLI